MTMLLKQSNKGHLGQSVKIVCCVCKIVYSSESISSLKPVNTSEFSLNFEKPQSLYDSACNNLKKSRNGVSIHKTK